MTRFWRQYNRLMTSNGCCQIEDKSENSAERIFSAHLAGKNNRQSLMCDLYALNAEGTAHLHSTVTTVAV